MSDQLAEKLKETTMETMEKLTFLFLSEEEPDQSDYKDAIAAEVVFRGNIHGRVVMILSASVLLEMAANMLGMDSEDDLPLVEQYDAFKETINVVCGNLLPVIVGKDEILTIDSPQIVLTEEEIMGSVDPHKAGEPAAVVRLTVEDDGRCDLFLFLKQQPMES